MTPGGLHEGSPNCPDREARRWLVLRTHGSFERIVEKRVTDAGFEALLPMCWVERTGGLAVRSRKPVRMPAPFFPGYVFAGVAEGQAWIPLTSVRGVAEVLRRLGNPEWPGEVPGEVIAALRAKMAEHDGCIDLATMNPPFAAGDEVRVKDGPFAGFNGIYQQRDAQARVVVLLALFGRASRVRLEARQVEGL